MGEKRLKQSAIYLQHKHTGSRKLLGKLLRYSKIFEYIICILYLYIFVYIYWYELSLITTIISIWLLYEENARKSLPFEIVEAEVQTSHKDHFNHLTAGKG